MKRILSIMLAGLFLLSLTACGEKKSGTTTIITEGDAAISSTVTENSDGTISVALDANKFDSLSGSVVGIQFSVYFENTTYDSSVLGEFPEGWSSTVTDKENANKNGEIVCLFIDDNLKTCFPNQNIATFNFSEISDTSTVEITNIKLVFYDEDKLTNDSIRGYIQKDFTAYPAE